MNKKAIVLLSGGIDSTTTLFLAKKEGYDVLCLIFDYSQRHKKEVKSAINIAKKTKTKYYLIKFKLPWGGSALLDKRINLPFNRSLKEMKQNIPATYVPFRNSIFLCFAVSLAEAIGANFIFIGANAIDFSGYPDCRPNYYNIFNKLIKVGAKKNRIKIITPLISKTKAEIVKLGAKLNVPFGLTWSCYKGERRPCEKCDSCILRAKGFKEAKIQDPLLFQ